MSAKERTSERERYGLPENEFCQPHAFITTYVYTVHNVSVFLASHTMCVCVRLCLMLPLVIKFSMHIPLKLPDRMRVFLFSSLVPHTFNRFRMNECIYTCTHSSLNMKD